jgi:hypothetical protein
MIAALGPVGRRSGFDIKSEDGALLRRRVEDFGAFDEAEEF